MITFTKRPSFRSNCMIFLLTDEEISRKKISCPDRVLRQHLSDILDPLLLGDKGSKVVSTVLRKKTYVLVDLGKAKALTFTAICRAVRNAVLLPASQAASSIEIIAPSADEKAVFAILDGILLGAYRWGKYLSDAKTPVSKKDIRLVAPARATYQEHLTVLDGVNFARDLINDNAEVVNSVHLEKTLRALIKGKGCISLKVLGEKELGAQGLRLHLAVNQGSKYPPRLLIAKYTGGKAREGYTALIGKGITFDTGGLNVKPSGHIETMREDMAGVAAVLGTLRNTLALGLKKNILFVMAIAENAIGSRAYKPGDVIKSYSGKTVEIANTDAEGRLVLADAISYVAKNYHPAAIIDIATLTGACAIALGYDYAGLISTDDRLAQGLLSASEETDDRLWRLPSYPELKDNITSQYADIKNTGLPKGVGGTINAAEFLRQFTHKIPWAHIDIAGTAFVDGPGRMYFGYGATGFGVRLLTRFLERH